MLKEANKTFLGGILLIFIIAPEQENFTPLGLS